MSSEPLVASTVALSLANDGADSNFLAGCQRGGPGGVAAARAGTCRDPGGTPEVIGVGFGMAVRIGHRQGDRDPEGGDCVGRVPLEGELVGAGARDHVSASVRLVVFQL